LNEKELVFVCTFLAHVSSIAGIVGYEGLILSYEQ